MDRRKQEGRRVNLSGPRRIFAEIFALSASAWLSLLDIIIIIIIIIIIMIIIIFTRALRL